MKISEFYTYAPKSRIKAGDANPNGKYQFYTSSPDENRRCDEYLYDCKAIVMGTGGSATIHYYDGKFSTSTDCLVLVPNEKIRAKYLYYFFLGNMSTLEAGFKGAGLKHTNKGYIDSIEIAKMPPLSKQDEIIELFDKLISRIKKQQNQIERLDELVKARFVEMFNRDFNNTVELGNVCDVRDGTHDSPKYHDEGYPLVTSKNICDGEIDFSTCSLIQKEDFDKINKRSKVDIGDILMPMIGTVGNPIIVNTNKEFAIKNVALIKFKDNAVVLNSFIKALLESDYFDRAVLSKTKGGTQKFISLGDIRKLEFNLPPIELQNQFATFVAQVDKSKFAISQSLLLLIKALSASFISHSEQISALLSSRDKAG